MFFDFYGSIWYCLTSVPPLEKVLRNAETEKKKNPQQNTAENVIEKKRGYKYVWTNWKMWSEKKRLGILS